MTTLRIVLGDQLSHGLASLRDLGPSDVVVMAEVQEECTYVPHHAQKIVLVLAAMRHFAAELRARGINVAYTRLDDPDNTHALRSEIARRAGEFEASRIIATEPGEWRVEQDMLGLEAATGLPVEIRQDDRFLCSRPQFAAWAAGRKSLRMEFFYREMRRQHDILMEDGAPCGEQWNFDAENRKRLPQGLVAPTAPRFAPDEITTEVIALVAQRFGNHIGKASDFAWPVTHAQAQSAFEAFLTQRLEHFGDWQDAMQDGSDFLFHSLISTSLNLGLLEALEICRAAERAYHAGTAPLNAVEGFIRQVLGWREFIRGIYWLRMPGYRHLNALGATRALPDFYWTGQTRMRCVAEAVRGTSRNAYAHHIQRLMITGNFALLAGLHPDEVDRWYLAVYADAYEWVEMPNTRGMALFADGGVVGSKPYAASGAYINKMSDHCGHCAYDVKQATGPRACPFNALYWDFIARNAERFRGNPRMAMPLMGLAKMAPARLAATRAQAGAVLTALDHGEMI